MDPSYLLSNEAFARRIAIGLLRDREGAEDLVQEAWSEILEHPEEVAYPRGYLATLLRRLSFRKRREESRRSERERASARARVEDDAAALVARAEIHRRTVTAVLALEEPYRATILQRFFEDRTPAEIAEHDGIPVETARTRLKRALAMLRARLEQEGRDWREEWAVALAGASPWPRSAPLPLRPLLSWAGAGVVAMVALVAWLAREEGSSAVARAPERAVGEVPRAARRVEVDPVRTSGPERVALEPPPEPPRALVQPALTGRVQDEAGRPLAGVRVLLAISRFGDGPELALAESDERGAFSCSLEEWLALSPVARGLLGLEVELSKPGHALLEREVELAPDGSCVELELVLAPGRLLTGRVLDPASLEGSVVVVARARGPDGRERTLQGVAGSDGRFAVGLEEGDAVASVVASSNAHGFARWPASAIPASTTGDVELPPLTFQRERVLRGRCLHPDGAPARRLELVVRQVEPDPAGGVRPISGSFSSEGRTRAKVTTDDSGRFLAAGLTAGPFQVLDGSRPLADGAAFPTGESELELEVTRRRLLIEVVDPSGRLLEEARLVVTRGSDADSPGPVLRAITSGVPPVAAVTVEPNEGLDVLVLAPGCAAREERFVVPAGAYAPELRVELAPEDARRAALLLEPSDGPSAGWSIDLCAPHSGLPLPGWQDRIADADGRVDGLPLGRYLVRLEPPRAPGSIPDRCAASATEAVVLGEGENRLAFALQPAARIRILFADASTQEDSATPLDEPVHDAGQGAWMAQWMSPARSRLELRPLAVDAGSAVRRIAELRPVAGRFLDLVVPAQPMRLHLVLDGREPLERELFPRAGETMEVDCLLTSPPAPR